MGNCLSPCANHRCSGEDEEVRVDVGGFTELQDVLKDEDKSYKPNKNVETIKVTHENHLSSTKNSPNKSVSSYAINANCCRSPKLEEVYRVVQKELEDLQTQLTKSQSVLSSLRYRQILIRDGSRVVELAEKSSQTEIQGGQSKCYDNRPEKSGTQKDDVQEANTTIQVSAQETKEQTCDPTGASTEPSNLMPPSPGEAGRLQTARSCPAIVSTVTSAVQTDLSDLTQSPKYYRHDEYFIPPISSQEFHDYQIDINGDPLGQFLESPIDLDIHRSCRKLSVLPEEPACNWRQMSDPGPAPSRSPRSTARPLQLPSRGDSAISSAGSSTSPPPHGSPPTASPLVSPSPSSPTTPSPSTAPSPTGALVPPSPPASPPPISSSSASLSFATPDDLPTDATLSPPSICRLPSRRKLVRSLATDNPSDSESPQKHNWELKDLMETCAIRVEPEMVSKGQQTDGPPLELDDISSQDVAPDETDSLCQNYISEKLIDTLINPALQDNSQSVEEIESMAVSLMIAYKADKHTLDRRLEIQTRLRDQSETNVANEITNLNEILSQLMPMCEEGEKGVLLRKLEEQIEMLDRSARYVSSVAEMYGAVQQEKRLFNAMEVLSRHVENLKQNLVNEKLLHEQTRKLLTENKPHTPLHIDNKRRASIAAVDQNHSSNDSRHSSRKGSLIKRFANCKSNSFSEICLDLRKGESNNSIQGHIMDDHGNELVDLQQDTTVSDCSDACRCTNNISLDSSREAEIELFQRKRASLQEDVPSSAQKKHYPMRYKFQKRSSFLAPRWFLRMAEAWGWNQMGDLAKKVRYSAACALVVAAFAILSYSFIAPDQHSI